MTIILRAPRHSTGYSEWNIGQVWTYFFENSVKVTSRSELSNQGFNRVQGAPSPGGEILILNFFKNQCHTQGIKAFNWVEWMEYWSSLDIFFWKFGKVLSRSELSNQGFNRVQGAPKYWRGNLNFKFLKKLISYSGNQGVRLGTVDKNNGHVWTYFYENSEMCWPAQSCPTRASTGYKAPQVLEGKFEF